MENDHVTAAIEADDQRRAEAGRDLEAELDAKMRQRHEESGVPYPDDAPSEPVVEAEQPYDIPPPPDTRPLVTTGFIVYITEDGKAIATSKLEETLEQLRFKREATLDDMLRGSLETTEDIRRMLQTEMVIQAQMNFARQIAEQQATQAMAQGLDLSKMRSKP
jgi:hypothetical protein